MKREWRLAALALIRGQLNASRPETFDDRCWSASREPQRSMTSRGYDPRQSPTSVARPLTRVAVPRVVAPSRNATVPPGTNGSATAGLTVAVRVTACPTMDGFGVEIRLV